MSIVIGVDPSASKHGIAVYIGGKLEHLLNLELMEIHQMLIHDFNSDFDNIAFVIEDVKANKAVWHGRSQNKLAFGMTSQNVAKCKQAQIELEKMLKFLGVKYVNKSISSQWKKSKGLFEKITGWKGSSNKDNRSAAYFGYLGCKTNINR